MLIVMITTILIIAYINNFESIISFTLVWIMLLKVRIGRKNLKHREFIFVIVCLSKCLYFFNR